MPRFQDAILGDPDTRMQNHAERFADRLVLPTLGLAVSTALLTRDFNRFLSLVIIDYSTGIRVAAPTAVLASMTNAAHNGVLIKSGSHMEKLAEVDTIVFDKTGTLSHGIPHVVEVLSYEELIKPDHLLALAVAAETHLHHPVAEALRKKSREMNVQPPPCDESLYRTGLGVEGCVNGYYMHVGNERFLRQSDIKVEHAGADRAAINERGCSSLYIAVDGKLAGLVAYEDRIRPESRQVIETLYGMGIRDTIMMTGDNTAVADAVGQRLGLTRQITNMLPSDKAEVIRQLQRDGRLVAVVGDGINDSPALSFADVGVADMALTRAGNEARPTQDFVATAATIGVIAAGVALFEVALIPGMVIGGAAVLAPKLAPRRLPKLHRRLQPLFNSTVRRRIMSTVPLPDRPDVKAPLAARPRFAIKQALAKTITLASSNVSRFHMSSIRSCTFAV
jgi:P-type E1-E2 ATPase